MASLKNVEAVKILSDKLQMAQSVVMIDYKGITATEDSNLRKIVADSENTEYVVAKNRLFKVALAKAGIKHDMDSILKGPTSFVFSYSDPLVSTRISKVFSDTCSSMEIKGGLIENSPVSAQDVKRIAELPSREILISMVASLLKGPINRLQFVLKNNITSLSSTLKAIGENKK